MLSKERLIDKLQQSDVFSRAYIVAMGMPSMEGNFRGGWDACIRTLKAVLERPQPEPAPQSDALDVDALWMAYRHFDERRSMFVMSLPEFRIALARAEQEARTLREQLARMQHHHERHEYAPGGITGCVICAEQQKRIAARAPAPKEGTNAEQG